MIELPIAARHQEILTPEACAFLAGIFKKFGARREELLARRVVRQRELDAGRAPRLSMIRRASRSSSAVWTPGRIRRATPTA